MPEVNDIEITVEFKVGSITTTLGDLSSIQPGYVFETDVSVNAPVTVEMNGAVLGRGELVRIGDRLGIRVTEHTTKEHPDDGKQP